MAASTLGRQVKRYTKSVEASVREAAKRGMVRKPQTSVEVGLVIVDRLDELIKLNRESRDLAQEVRDLLRGQVSLNLPVSYASLTSDRLVCRRWKRPATPMMATVRRRSRKGMRRRASTRVSESPWRRMGMGA